MWGCMLSSATAKHWPKRIPRVSHRQASAEAQQWQYTLLASLSHTLHHLRDFEGHESLPMIVGTIPDMDRGMPSRSCPAHEKQSPSTRPFTRPWKARQSQKSWAEGQFAFCPDKSYFFEKFTKGQVSNFHAHSAAATSSIDSCRHPNQTLISSSLPSNHLFCLDMQILKG